MDVRVGVRVGVGGGGGANSLLCRWVTGVVAAVGVTGPPDFRVNKLLKKFARAPSLAAVAPAAVAVV